VRGDGRLGGAVGVRRAGRGDAELRGHGDAAGRVQRQAGRGGVRPVGGVRVDAARRGAADGSRALLKQPGPGRPRELDGDVLEQARQ
jgi:hypothetical protein